jgi:GDPmannose 4,6-dehydratase
MDIDKLPKLVITGCDGMIAHYIKDQFSNYALYGIGRTESKCIPDSRIISTYFDMNDAEKLESYLSNIKPDVIIHLASISNTHTAFSKPIETLYTNGLLAAHLCDIIYRNGWKTKLFNASSSEIYKGHVDYTVTDDDSNMHHIHPYSIAKIMSHTIVDFYRNTYGLPFSNGVLFTTESRHRQPSFLLSKVANYIKTWDSNQPPLEVGNLDSYRNIVHAKDVVRAIDVIVSRDVGDSYVICNNQSSKMIDMVLCLFKNAGMEVELRENVIYMQDRPMLIINDNKQHSSFEPVPTNIRGISSKLKSLGWEPSMNIEQILRELYM